MDTSASVAIRFRGMIMKRNPVERLLMGFSMYDAARTIVMSAITEQNPQISSEGIRKELFLRFYGKEYDGVVRERILRALGTLGGTVGR